MISHCESAKIIAGGLKSALNVEGQAFGKDAQLTEYPRLIGMGFSIH